MQVIGSGVGYLVHSVAITRSEALSGPIGAVSALNGSTDWYVSKPKHVSLLRTSQEVSAL